MAPKIKGTTIIAGILIGIVMLMLGSYLIKQFVPGFTGLSLDVGLLFFVMIIAGIIAVALVEKKFELSKSSFLTMLIVVVGLAMLVIFAPKLLSGTAFEQSAIALQSIFG